MGLYGDNKDYEQIIKENIYKAKLLYGLSKKDQESIINLINKKEIIKEKNELLAKYHLKLIDKKIDKIKKFYN